ncbi:centrosomal protein of 72 kDa-like isoform X2 [Narcine bancroftii]|uniref:centrosomal protein of 72 kDa-like isoform X2 n=1 Tax=Narcine bancroftii TaxID=1343680 RepID=UPI0038312B04
MRLRSEARSERMALKATEEWVRRRVALEEERLADVRSLFLPGSGEEKITHLGKSLKNFTRLKFLDLSHNSLISLEGIQDLKYLEKLNLYYNNIADLKEIFLLRNLGNLKELDTRLNPVSRNKSDYRLFVIHLLPNLKRLDDRPVRDSERKAALMHFNSDEAHKFYEYPAQNAENLRPRHPRAEFVGSLAKKYSKLDKDDEAVLNFIAKSNWDMNVLARITGSVKNIPEAEMHNLQGIHETDDARSKQSAARNTTQATLIRPNRMLKGAMNSKKKNSSEFQALCEDYQSLPDVSCPRSGTIACHTEATARPNRVTSTDEEIQGLSAVDPNLKFQDEAEAYHKVTSHPHFTPHPGSTHNTSATEHQLPRSKASCTSTDVMPATGVIEEKQKAGDQHARMQQVLMLHGGHPTTMSLHSQVEDPHHKRPPVTQRSGGAERRASDTSNRFCEKIQSIPCKALLMDCQAIDQNIFNPNLMENFLDLVDRYWNGFKSLHCNEKFLNQAAKIMSAMQEYMFVKKASAEIKAFQDEASNLKSEIKSLENCLCQQNQQYTEELQTLSIRLSQAQRDMDIMKDHLNQTVDEKNHLQNLLIKQEQKAQNTSSSTNQQIAGHWSAQTITY